VSDCQEKDSTTALLLIFLGHSKEWKHEPSSNKELNMLTAFAFASSFPAR
jgi:hypothetical protein